MNYPMPSSSPIAEALPSPNLTEPSLSSPKNLSESGNNVSNSSSTSINTSTTASSNPASPPAETSPMLSALLRSVSSTSLKAKELNITEYSNKELKAMKKRCRTVMTPSQSRVLRKVLEQTAFPSTEIRENLAKILGMKPRTVQIWFQNQRQKSRQGRSSEDLTMMGSPDGGSSDGTDIDDSTGSPYLSPRTSGGASSTSPGFKALSAAAFALSNTPLNTPLDSAVNVSDPQRYSTFHGAVFKSTPGFIPSGMHRGNTAAAISANRTSAAAGAHFMPGSAQPGFLPPAPPQKIPSYPVTAPSVHYYPPSGRSTTPNSNQSSSSMPLDVLASAVSNFRPNGYNYFIGQQPSMMQRPVMTTPGSQQQVQPPQHPTSQISNRNRLAPLRTPSPPSSSTTPVNATLPSLKDLAQVASLGMEIEQRRSKSLTESQIPAEKFLPPVRRFSAEVSNTSAPNAAVRRPW